MTKYAIGCLMFVTLPAFSTGCAHTAITGSSSHHELVVKGDVGISGDDIEFTILPGSDVTKLSIIGEDNHVFILDGATVQKIEIVGEDNEVTCPEGMTAEFTQIGEDNRLKYRSK